MEKIKGCLLRLLKKLGIEGIGEDTARLFVIQMITLVISFLPSILISRTLGPEMKGRYDLFTLLTGYISDFGLLGFGAGLLFYQMKKEHDLATVHGTGIVYSVIMAAVLAAVGISTVQVWKEAFEGLPVQFLVLAFAISPFLLYKLIFNQILLGMNKAVVNYIFGLILGISDAVLISFLYICRALSYSAVICLVSLEGIGLCIAGGMYIYLRSGRRLHFDLSLCKRALRYGIVVYLGTIANSVLFKIDILFLNIYASNEAVGIYSVAVRWAEMIFLLDSAISAATIYKMGSMDGREARTLTIRTMKLQAIVSGTLAAGMLIFSYPLVYFIYGTDYIGAVSPLIILLPGLFCWSVGRIVSQYVVYKLEKAQWCTYAAIIGSAVNVVLNMLFIPRQGMNGAALASTCSYILVVGIVIFYGLRKGRRDHGI